MDELREEIAEYFHDTTYVDMDIDRARSFADNIIKLFHAHGYRKVEKDSEALHLGFFYNDEVGITDIYVLDKDGNETDREVKAKCLLARIAKYFNSAKLAKAEITRLQKELDRLKEDQFDKLEKGCPTCKGTKWLIPPIIEYRDGIDPGEHEIGGLKCPTCGGDGFLPIKPGDLNIIELVSACTSILESLEDRLIDCDSSGTRQTLQIQIAYLKKALNGVRVKNET
jgi:hypothetical protein